MTGKVVCDLGSGRQFFTAFFMLMDGADKIILVDPVFPMDISNILKAQLIIFNKKIKPSVEIDLNKIQHFNYLEDLDEKWNSKLDFICSHFVLEHFRNLDSFFAEVKRLLRLDGLSINKVDLSGHTYHILEKYPFIYKYIKGREINYMRYSEKVFNSINDNKCYMNRIPLPVYYKYAKQYNLKIEKIDASSNRQAAKPHQDILEKYDIKYSELLQTVGFTMWLRKK